MRAARSWGSRKVARTCSLNAPLCGVVGDRWRSLRSYWVLPIHWRVGIRTACQHRIDIPSFRPTQDPDGFHKPNQDRCRWGTWDQSTRLTLIGTGAWTSDSYILTFSIRASRSLPGASKAAWWRSLAHILICDQFRWSCEVNSFTNALFPWAPWTNSRSSPSDVTSAVLNSRCKYRFNQYCLGLFELLTHLALWSVRSADRSTGATYSIDDTLRLCRVLNAIEGRA